MAFRKKSQAWSVDIILAVLIFMGAFFAYYILVNSNGGTQTDAIKQEATSVIKQVASAGSGLNVVDNQELNETKIGELKNLDYDELKSRLSIEGDFCIYMEDENGNLVLINQSYRGVGSPDINISGVPCSQK